MHVQIKFKREKYAVIRQSSFAHAMAGHLTLSFRLMEMRNLSEVFIRISDSYPGPGHWRQFGEQSALTSTSPSNGIIEASTSGASCNQKDRQEKRKRNTIHGPKLEP